MSEVILITNIKTYYITVSEQGVAEKFDSFSENNCDVIIR